MAPQRSGSSSPSSGDHYNSEKAGASCWSPRTWHTGSNFGLRAEDTPPRSFAPRDSGRPIRVRTRREVRLAGLSPLPVELQPCRGANPSLNTRPARSALSQHVVKLPALRFSFHSIAPHTASACPGTTSASFVFGTSDRFELCPRAGMLEYRRNNQQPRHPIWPFCCGPRTACKFAARAAPFFAGHHRITGAGTKGLILASAPGVSARVTLFCPFFVKTGGTRWDILAMYFVFSVQAYRRFISVSVQASILLALLQIRMTGNLSLLVVQRSAFSHTTAPLHPSLQQNIQPSLTQKCSRTY